MKMSPENRKYLENEIKFVRKQMNQTQNPVVKNYLFSAVYGAAYRIMNLEYDPKLVFLHNITQNTYQQIQGLLNKLAMGDQTLIIADNFWKELDKCLNDLQKTINSEEDHFYPILEKMVCLAYGTTGNGNYLRMKGIKLIQ